jgi:hypothetical protein
MQGAPVDAVIGAEGFVFGSDHRGDGRRRYAPQMHDVACITFAFDHAREHERRNWGDHGIEADKADKNNQKRETRPA